jgi:hypothetical protein
MPLKTLWLIYFKSFANVSKVTTDQLQSLPGFGQVKVKNIKNAFEKPFRNQTTTSLSTITQMRKSAVQVSSQVNAVHHDQPTGSGHVSRESSPIWDIELDEGELPSDNWGFKSKRFDIEYWMSTLFPTMHSNGYMNWEGVVSKPVFWRLSKTKISKRLALAVPVSSMI